MNDANGFLMEKGCPWVNLRELTGVGNVRWCEDQLCSWITTPNNTWTNLGFILVGIFLFYKYREEKSPAMRFYFAAAQWVGWTSFIWHASLTFVTQVLDFLGMFVFFYLILGQNFSRIGWLPQRQLKKVVWALTLMTTVLSAFVDRYGFPIQGLIVALIVGILITEVLANRRATRPISYRYFALSLTALGIGAAFSASDVTRKFCDPSNHWLQGHGLWHLFGAVSLFFSFHYYRQFYSRKTGELEV